MLTTGWQASTLLLAMLCRVAEVRLKLDELTRVVTVIVIGIYCNSGSNRNRQVQS